MCLCYKIVGVLCCVLVISFEHLRQTRMERSEVGLCGCVLVSCSTLSQLSSTVKATRYGRPCFIVSGIMGSLCMMYYSIVNSILPTLVTNSVLMLVLSAQLVRFCVRGRLRVVNVRNQAIASVA